MSVFDEVRGSGEYVAGPEWWAAPHEKRQTVLAAIEALELNPANVHTISFRQDKVIATVLHVTEEAGVSHWQGHCRGEPMEDPCVCSLAFGMGHTVCYEEVERQYP